MATAMKRLGVYLGLVEDDPNYDGYGYGSAESGSGGSTASERPVAPVSTLPRKDFGSVDVRQRPDPAPTSAHAPIDPYSIHTIHPRSYNDARRIGEEYRAGSPVIMNLTEMSDSDAKRIVDFAAGLVFAMRGSIERITNKVFLLSPANVDVRDAPAVQQARDGFFNQS
jgi:cell division inhibitor SepF